MQLTNIQRQNYAVLLAIVDATYKFILVDFGIIERISEGGNIQKTLFLP